MKNYNNPYPSVMAVAKRPDICFVRGKGSWLWDNHGKAYQTKEAETDRLISNDVGASSLLYLLVLWLRGAKIFVANG